MTPVQKPVRVRLVRVIGKPQNYAVYDFDNGALLGYAGRDGVITDPIGDTQAGLVTEIVRFDDQRKPSKGLNRSILRAEKMLTDAAANATGSADLDAGGKVKWEIITRVEAGLYLYESTPTTDALRVPNGFFHLVWEVEERRMRKGVWLHRKRIEYGPPCHKFGEAYAAFETLYSVYRHHALDHEEGAHHHRLGMCVPKESPASATSPEPGRHAEDGGRRKKPAAKAKRAK